MKKLIGLISILSFIIVLLTPYTLLANPDSKETQEFYEKAQVLKVENIEPSNQPDMGGQIFQEQIITVKMLSGKYEGKVLQAHNTLSGSKGYDLHVSSGDKVILYITEKDGELSEIYLADMARVSYNNYLILLFILSVIIVGGIKGMKSLVALGFTVLAIYKILLPALLNGSSPIMITIVVLIGVTLVTMFIIAGVSRKSVSATIGTIGGVVVAGLLAMLVGDIAHLTGFADEESRMLLYVEGLNIDMQGLLFSGIIIGALGAIMDVAMSIASSIDEIKKANPMITTSALMRAGMNVGRDIMGTMTNTLILAYAGGALPLLMLYMAYDTSTVRIFNSELIATEVVRAISGSIGLIFSVPITAFVASFLSSKYAKESQVEYYNSNS